MRRLTPPLAACLSAAALAGCSTGSAQTDPTTSTSTSTVPAVASPTSTTTSSATPAPTPSVAMTMGYRVSDVQAAEAAYRKFDAELFTIEKAGGANTLPQSLDGMVTGEARGLFASWAKGIYDHRIRAVSGSPRSTILPLPKTGSGNSVRLLACDDRRSVIYRWPDGGTAKGNLVGNTVTLVPLNGHWVVSDNTAQRNDKRCRV